MIEKPKELLVEEIEKVLNTLREGISMHGGEVRLIDIDMETGKVTLKLEGACVGCPYSDITLKSGIEETLMQLVPEVTEVVNVA